MVGWPWRRWRPQQHSRTNDEKAVAIWQTAVKYRHQCPPPKGFIQNEGCVHDVMKTIHVYGYDHCCCASANVAQLARFLGWEARGWAITLHSVPEVYYDDAWHLLAGSVMNFFRNPDGSLASVAEIARAVRAWHEANPGYRGDDAKLRKFARGGNWRKAGPALLTTTDTYGEDGPNAAGWHGWSSTMIEYDKADKHYVYEYGYSQGYRPSIALRPGERLTRNWFNKGLHVNMDGSGGNPGGLLKGRGELGLQKKLGDIAPGDIVRLRGGAHYRARDKREGWTLQASFDEGKTWAELGKLPGPTPGTTRYFALENVPMGTRKALVRYQSTRQYNTLCIFDFRIDADYAEPAGGFRPVKITYAWEEGGAEKRHVHVAQKPNGSYTITCAAPPLMKSIILEPAD